MANGVEATGDVVAAAMQALPAVMSGGVKDGRFVYLPLPGAVEATVALGSAEGVGLAVGDRTNPPSTH